MWRLALALLLACACLAGAAQADAAGGTKPAEPGLAHVQVR